MKFFSRLISVHWKLACLFQIHFEWSRTLNIFYTSYFCFMQVIVSLSLPKWNTTSENWNLCSALHPYRAVDNGICPTWQLSTLVFDVIYPDISFLRFTVYEEDMFSDPNFLAHATFTVRNLKTGEYCWILCFRETKQFFFLSVLIIKNLSVLHEE